MKQSQVYKPKPVKSIRKKKEQEREQGRVTVGYQTPQERMR